VTLAKQYIDKNGKTNYMLGPIKDLEPEDRQVWSDSRGTLRSTAVYTALWTKYDAISKEL
jgi:hypothetical protein